MKPGSLSRQKWVVLVVVMVAIFSPSVLDWVLDPAGAWYRPFIVWMLVIIAAFVMQLKSWRYDDF